MIFAFYLVIEIMGGLIESVLLLRKYFINQMFPRMQLLDIMGTKIQMAENVF